MSAANPLSLRRILVFSAPIIFMWLLMALEQPIIAAAIARLPNPELNLAAFGLAFSLALIIESPVIMLLTAGTAQARDAQSYRLLFRFTTTLAIALTVLHLIVVATPLYGWLVGGLVGAPRVLIPPGRLALALMLAWPAAIAFRRLWQGVLIRYDRTSRVGMTTVARITALVGVCVVGVRTGALGGAALGGLALSVGVTVAAIAAFFLVRPTVAEHLTRELPDTDRPLTRPALLRFYVPLALTSFIVLGGMPLLSFGISRADDAIIALAVWPVLIALLFVFRSPGYAHQEVVVALYDRPTSPAPLKRYTTALALGLSAALAALALTRLADVWLVRLAGLPPPLVEAARNPLVLLIPVPALTVLIAWHRGRLVLADRTTAITQAVGVNLIVMAVVVSVGLRWPNGPVPGADLAAIALGLALAAEGGWLAARLKAEG